MTKTRTCCPAYQSRDVSTWEAMSLNGWGSVEELPSEIGEWAERWVTVPGQARKSAAVAKRGTRLRR